MSNQIVITSGAKLRDLDDVIIGTDGILSSVAFNVANGVPRLDENGKILVSQLPNSVMEFKGVWNAATNSPTLVNGTGNAGDVWLCNVAGTVNFGAGPIAFAVGDYAVYTGTEWARSSGATGTVTSVGVSRDGNALAITGSPVTSSGTINLGFSGDNSQYINGAGNLTTFPTVINSIGLTMPAAFGVSNSPLTANGTIGVTALGYPSQYIRGDGTLADFPTSGGGGSSVSYYLNGGTSQGSIGGTTYYEMSKTADTGTGVDFSKTGDGFITAFLTDAGDPALLQIPAGNWNYEIYASMSSNGGTPEMYAELYVYDGTTFTLLSTSAHEILYDGINLNLYTFAMAVPETVLTVTDRLAIKLYATNSGGKTTTIHTQDSHLCQVITTFTTGLTALNGLTAQVQYFATGTSGSDFNIVSSVSTHTFNIPSASATARGLITTGTQTIAGAKTFTGGVTFNSSLTTTSNITFANSGYFLTLQPPTLSVNRTVTLPNGTGTLALTSDISYPVTSVFGRTGAVVATSGDYTTAQVTESGNLYFTDARARTAISLTTTGSTGAATYNNTTGVLNIPNYADQYVGTVTSVAMSVPTGLTVSGSPITTSGTLALTLTAGYSIPTTANQSTWTTAYNRSLTSAAVTGTTTKTLTLNQQDGGTITASWTDINTDAVTSVFGRTGAVVAVNGDYYIGTTAVQASSANQALTGITGITFVAESSDAASITTTISGSSTYFDFNLNDDNSNDEWRWRFTPSGASVYNAMRLVPTTNTTSNLIVSGTIVASNFSGSSIGTNTGDQSLSTLGGVVLTTPTNGQVLKYNGTNWVNDTDANTGTVTSVAMTVPTGLSIAGSPITSSGTLAVTLASGYSIPTNASQTTWDTAYTNRITSLTTTGTSGAATLTSNVLNIPNYTTDLSGYVTLATTQTISGAKTFTSNVKTNTLFGFSAYTTDTDDFGIWATSGANGGTTIATGGGTNIRLRTNNTDRLTISASATFSGDIGWGGVTPTGNAGICNTIESSQGAQIAARQGYPQVYISSNVSGTPYAPTRKVAGYATQLVLDSFGGTIGLGRAITSTAGSSITWIQNLGFDNTGAATFSSSISATSATFSSSVTASSFSVGEMSYNSNQIYRNSANEMYVNYSGTGHTLVGNTTSNVGIGAGTNPPQKLTVNGNVAVGGQQGFWLRDDDGFSGSAARRAWIMTANYAVFGMLSFYAASSAGANPLSGTAFLNITSGGNVLIGTTSDDALSLHRLQVNGYARAVQWRSYANGEDVAYGGGFYQQSTSGTTYAIATLMGSAGQMRFWTYNPTNSFVNHMTLTNDGNLLLGSTTPSTGKLQVNGTVYATGFYESSDIRLKNIIETNPSINVLGIDVIKFTRKDNDINQIRYGYSAQQVQTILSDVVSGNEFLNVNYLDIHTLKIAQLEQRIKELEFKLN